MILAALWGGDNVAHGYNFGRRRSLLICCVDSSDIIVNWAFYFSFSESLLKDYLPLGDRFTEKAITSWLTFYFSESFLKDYLPLGDRFTEKTITSWLIFLLGGAVSCRGSSACAQTVLCSTCAGLCKPLTASGLSICYSAL
jgi:hypothetical protein